MGIFVLAIIVIAFVAGALGSEIGLMLAGAVFLAIWGYCLLMTLLLALLHSRRASRACIRVSPREVAAGAVAEAFYSEGDAAAPVLKVFQLPGVLVRCRLLLATKDGRRIWHDFNPAKSGPHPFDVKKRGAYFSAYDEFAVCDILGFFRFVFRLAPESARDLRSAAAQTSPRILAKPHPAGEPPPVNARAGDSNLKLELSLQRTDILIDHRPYVPGDDPRRINWKLYGHGGSLIVREGEREPPPHSNLAILIDSEYDPALYGESEARRGIDLLCGHALAAAIACAKSGMDVLVGCLGSAPSGGDLGSAAGALSLNFAAALAWPAARSMQKGEASPSADAASSAGAADLQETQGLPAERGILVMALPRSCIGTNLDMFLKKNAGRGIEARGRSVDLLFLCHHGELAKTADPAKALSPQESERLAATGLCVSLFGQRPGVKARSIRISV